MYSIELEGLDLEAEVGCYPEEQGKLQSVRIDLTLDLDLDHRTLKDELGMTLDYGAVLTSIQSLLQERKWNLLEILCRDITQMLFKLSPHVTRVKLRAQKFVFAELDSVGVLLDLRRDQL